MASRSRVEFKNNSGETLYGLFEEPEQAVGYAIFAHCFTCSKDIAAASRISRALSNKGIAVLRFDFTGLGNSDGDFSNTNFSSNVEDLESAASFMRSNYQAPGILIGHSLGGAAVLVAAMEIPEVKAVVTIGAPATASHVKHNFAVHEADILEKGLAEVTLAGRKFTIKEQFLKDIDQYDRSNYLAKMRKALLVMHSPIDETVSINEAAKIYTNAKHPKSFISLDKADHLLTRKEDSEYVAGLISAWVEKYI
ncbi:MAG: alpha/beta fold hydrolase [Calditrichaeota bacterium]|nr:MAG: alpha/beta fold hydrolase [Calditrichota bacterium]MBL1207330.1 alpha/beta fold hydrolase [Calditrichota bacterium]NOG47163.1 alpha/beta fold hydrolase [Calditrichota bacterium]